MHPVRVEASGIAPELSRLSVMELRAVHSVPLSLIGQTRRGFKRPLPGEPSRLEFERGYAWYIMGGITFNYETMVS